MKDAFPGDETNTSPDRVLVVGVGNRILGDEGVGPCVIDNLSRMKLPPYVNVFDCGCDLLSIVLYLDRPEKIIIVDAVRAGGKPGEIYRYDYSELATMKDETQSGHQIGTIDVLRLLKSVYPVLADTEITVIGIEPKTLELGNNLSQEVEERIVDVTMLVVEEICHSASFWQEKVQSDSHRFRADHKFTTPCKGQVPGLTTKMQENRKAQFPMRLRSASRYCRLLTRKPYLQLGPGQY